MSAESTVKIRPAESADLETLLRWRRSLWPKLPHERHEAYLREIFSGKLPSTMPLQIFIAEGKGLAGFIEVGLRSHADGCDPRQPVAYIEAWYVEPAFQKRGIGKALYLAAEAWARGHGCRELASDTWIEKPEAQRAHEALGFEIVDRCVHYRKKL